MRFNPNDLPKIANYKLLSGTVLPRPIGWISTVSKTGVYNLAPFSFFNGAGSDPPHVMFATERPLSGPKDTLQNVLDTGQFVANLVHEEVAEQMNLTATILPAEIDEFEFGQVTAVASDIVAPPRVAESLVSFECQLVHSYELEGSKEGGAVIIIGKILLFHIHDSILQDDYKIDLNAFKPIGRLAGGMYTRVNDLFRMDRLPPQK